MFSIPTVDYLRLFSHTARNFTNAKYQVVITKAYGFGTRYNDKVGFIGCKVIKQCTRLVSGPSWMFDELSELILFIKSPKFGNNTVFILVW